MPGYAAYVDGVPVKKLDRVGRTSEPAQRIVSFFAEVLGGALGGRDLRGVSRGTHQTNTNETCATGVSYRRGKLQSIDSINISVG